MGLQQQEKMPLTNEDDWQSNAGPISMPFMLEDVLHRACEEHMQETSMTWQERMSIAFMR